MSVIRVGFVLGEIGWIGGTNYFRNLFSAIQSLPNPKIQPVVFTGLKSDISDFDGLAVVVRTRLLDRGSIFWFLYKIFMRVIPSRNFILYLILKKHQIDLISHTGELWRNCSIPSIGWIPDFQHFHLKHFFTRKDIDIINKSFLNRIYRSNAILLSSADALNDLKIFYPDNKTPTFVLRFTSCMLSNSITETNKHDLEKLYNLNKYWFHIPNQFWAHKNHNVIIEALYLLKQKGKDVLVISTGSTTDYRNPDYFASVQNKINEYGLTDNFKILGIVPYSDVIALMRYSVAVINPSLFEGWSTTVEEAKSLGKSILLSDIPVHREQSPVRGHFFKANSAEQLAEEMMNTLVKFDPFVEEIIILENKSHLDERKRNFAKNYEDIVIQLYEKHNLMINVKKTNFF